MTNQMTWKDYQDTKKELQQSAEKEAPLRNGLFEQKSTPKIYFAIAPTRAVFDEWARRANIETRPRHLTSEEMLFGMPAKGADLVFYLLDGYELCEVILTGGYKTCLKYGAKQIIDEIGAQRSAVRYQPELI